MGNNYYQTINYEGKGVVNLWGLDSNEDRCLGVKGWGCIDPNVR